MNHSSSRIGFRYAMIALTLFAVTMAIMAVFIILKIVVPAMLFGIVFLVAIVISIVGLTYSIRGIREPNDARKIIGLVLNLFFTGVLVLMIIANILDIVRALG